MLKCLLFTALCAANVRFFFKTRTKYSSISSIFMLFYAETACFDNLSFLFSTIVQYKHTSLPSFYLTQKLINDIVLPRSALEKPEVMNRAAYQIDSLWSEVAKRLPDVKEEELQNMIRKMALDGEIVGSASRKYRRYRLP